jgi:hypothetical protein
MLLACYVATLECARLAKIAPMFDKFLNFKRGSIENKVLSLSNFRNHPLSLKEIVCLMLVPMLFERVSSIIGSSLQSQQSLGFLLRCYSPTAKTCEESSEVFGVLLRRKPMRSYGLSGSRIDLA